VVWRFWIKNSWINGHLVNAVWSFFGNDYITGQKYEDTVGFNVNRSRDYGSRCDVDHITLSIVLLTLVIRIGLREDL
jgi:hypothetical protein